MGKSGRQELLDRVEVLEVVEGHGLAVGGHRSGWGVAESGEGIEPALGAQVQKTTSDPAADPVVVRKRGRRSGGEGRSLFDGGEQASQNPRDVGDRTREQRRGGGRFAEAHQAGGEQRGGVQVIAGRGEKFARLGELAGVVEHAGQQERRAWGVVHPAAGFVEAAHLGQGDAAPQPSPAVAGVGGEDLIVEGDGLARRAARGQILRPAEEPERHDAQHCTCYPAEMIALILAAAAVASEVEVATIVAFTEGPTVDASGNVYFTDTQNSRILKLATDGTLSTFRQPSNRANGLVFDAQWRLLACEAQPPRVTRTDVQTGRVEVLVERYEGRPLNGPNDITIDGRGRVYFTDPGNPGGGAGGSAVFRIDSDGRVTRILAAPAIQRPNGLIVSPDDRTFYLVESNQADKGARVIRAYDLQADGSVTNMRVFHNFYPGRSADGLCIDSKGNLYAAAGLHRRRGTSETLDTKPGVHVFSPAGKLLDFIPIPEDTITNCAFGGPDLKTLYVTAGKTLFRYRVATEGTRR